MSETVTTVSEVLKDAAPYATMSTGAGMTQIPMPWIQLAGVAIGTGGLIVATLRWRVATKQQEETKRANDLNQMKWEHERGESINDEKAKAKDGQ